MIKHYKTKEEAQANCGIGQKLVLEGNADRRWRVVSDEKFGEIIASTKGNLLGSDTQTRTGNFPGL